MGSLWSSDTPRPPALTPKQGLSDKEIKQVYEELMIPNFPVQDELDPLELWLANNEVDGNAWKSKPWARRFFAMLDGTRIVGLCVVETFQPSPPENITTALLAYLVVDEKYRKQGISKALVKMAAKDHPVLFLETETVPSTVGEARTERGNRMNVHKHNGFASIEKFHYVQPPCAPDQGPCDDLTLMVYIGGGAATPATSVDSSKVKSFCEKMCVQYEALDTPYGKEMMDLCGKNKTFELSTALFVA